MLKTIQISLPTNLQYTMDPKFLFVLFFVEAGCLVFNSLHMTASQLHVYNAYNQLPVILDIESKPYSCFSTVSYCIYGNRQLLFLKVLALVFISIIVICYGCLFIIIVRKWENVKIHSSLVTTWYTGLQSLLLLALALRTLLMIILLERDTVNTDQCNRQNRLIRVENLFNYFVLCLLELAYIGCSLLNQQASPTHTLHPEFEYGTQAAEHLRPSSSDNNRRGTKNWK